MPVPRVDVRARRRAADAPRAPSASRVSTRQVSRCCPSRSTRGARSCSSTRDPDAAPLHDALGDLPRARSPQSGVDLDGIRFHSHHEWEQPVNWKVALENYLECYHCPVAHPGFSKLIDVDPDSYRLVAGAKRRASSARCEAALEGSGKAPYDPQATCDQSQYHFLLPNTTINIAPGPQNLSIERWVPIGARTTVEVTDYFFGDRT